MGRISQKSLVDEVGTELSRMISTRALAPGARIKQVELSRLLGTSRVPLREALRELSERGLVVYHPRRGYRVNALTLAAVEDIYATRLALDRLAIEQLLRHRDISVTTESIAGRLRDLGAAVAARDVDGVIEADLAFHRAIAVGSENQVLIKVYGLVTGPVRPALAVMVPDELDEDLVEQHGRILAAIKARDLSATTDALVAHNAFALDLLRRLLARENGTDRPGDNRQGADG
jgi:DNA-binding GntR family transcriptional regulator